MELDIKKDLPGWGNRGPVTKTTLTEYLTEIWKKNPDEYEKIVSNLKFKGDYLATYNGITVGMKELRPAYELKKKYIGLKPEEFSKKRKEIEKEVLEHSKKSKTSFADMIVSKARGNPSQLMQMILSPGYYANSKGETIPIQVKHSFSEGLSPGEYMTSSYGARLGVVFPQLATASSGALSKELLNNTTHYIVTMRDCGTTKGIPVPTASGAALDRYLPRPFGRFPRNTLVTPMVQKELLKEGIKEIEVRSPLTCLAKKGVCSYCLGPVAEHDLPPKGFAAGVTSSHALGEKITQLMLSFKHTGGLAGTANPVEAVEAMLHLPEKFPNKATLAEINGKVSGIEELPTGAKYVHIGGIKHFIPPNTKLSIKEGMEVKKGDPISEGYVNPKEYAKLKGISAAKRLFSDTLHSIFKASGFDIHPKHFEVLSNSVLDTVRVKGGKPEEYGLLEGDLVSMQSLKEHLLDQSKFLPKKESIGKYSATEYDGVILPGEKIQEKHLKHLPDYVHTIEHPIEIEPDFQSLVRSHLHKSDWMTGLARSYLKDVILRAAEEGKKSKLGFPETPINNYVMAVKAKKID